MSDIDIDITEESLEFDVTATGPKGNDGNDGADGDSSYTYVAYASDDQGTGFSLTPSASLTHIAVLTTDTEIDTPEASDFSGLWTEYKSDIQSFEDLSDTTITDGAENDLLTLNDSGVWVNKTKENVIGSYALEKEEFGIVRGDNRSFASSGDWVNQIGNPTRDFNTTIDNALYIDFSSSNESIMLEDVLDDGQEYICYITHQLISGTPTKLLAGLFSSSTGAFNFEFSPTEEKREERFVFTGSISKDFALGCLSSNNNGSSYAIYSVEIYKGNELIYDLKESTDVETINIGSFNENTFLHSLSKFDKTLTKMAVIGDSLMANSYGGSIPVGEDEGDTMRPVRLTYNNIPRRIYDELKFNPASHRRLDHTDWTQSGVWSEITEDLFPAYSNEKYFSSTESGAYVEIDVPNGQENFAFICQTFENGGVLNVTINGGDISSYGVSSVDTDRTSTNESDVGNPFFTVEYNDLPAGINTIRISKEANTEEVRIWGGFYWSGNTFVLHNLAKGGRSLGILKNNHLPSDLPENNFDAILFQLPIMNEMSRGRSIEESNSDMLSIYEDYLRGNDFLFMTCNPFGDNDSGTNYYTTYTDPTMQDTILKLKKTSYLEGMPFLDVFQMFKQKIENRGGTLEGGEGGLYYTTDGQHPNEAGAKEWFNLIKRMLINIPIKY